MTAGRNAFPRGDGLSSVSTFNPSVSALGAVRSEVNEDQRSTSPPFSGEGWIIVFRNKGIQEEQTAIVGKD